MIRQWVRSPQKSVLTSLIATSLCFTGVTKFWIPILLMINQLWIWECTRFKGQNSVGSAYGSMFCCYRPLPFPSTHTILLFFCWRPLNHHRKWRYAGMQRATLHSFCANTLCLLSSPRRVSITKRFYERNTENNLPAQVDILAAPGSPPCKVPYSGTPCNDPFCIGLQIRTSVYDTCIPKSGNEQT